MIKKILSLGIVIVVILFLLFHPSSTWFLNESKKALGIVQEGELQRPSLFGDQLYVGQVLKKTDDDCLISVPGMAQTVNGQKETTHLLTVNDCEQKENEYVEVVFGGTLVENKEKESSQSAKPPSITDVIHRTIRNTFNPTQPATSPQLTVTVQPLQPQKVCEKIVLNTWREGNDIIASFSDTGKNTVHGTILIKNSQKEIFSGKFFSNFTQVRVADPSQTAITVDSFVEHLLCGNVNTFVLNPSASHGSNFDGTYIKP